MPPNHNLNNILTNQKKKNLFRCSYKDIPGNAVRSSFEGPLKDLLVYSKPKSVKKIFYQLLPMNISELENKKQFKCLWVRATVGVAVVHIN